MPVPDPQKERLYRWEGKWKDWNRKTVSLKEARSFVHTGCAYYGVAPPRVVSHGGRGLSFYQANHAITTTSRAAGKFKSIISFNREYGLNIPTALHEAAHAISATLLPWEMADHDPRFVGVYMWLLIKAKVAPRTALETSLEAAGVKWIGPQVSPRYLEKK